MLRRQRQVNPVALLPRWLRPGTRIVSVLVGCGFAIWYVVEPPSNHDRGWPGTAAAVIATLIVALVVSQPFNDEGLKRWDAWPAAFALLTAVISLLLAMRAAAFHTAFSVPVGAIVLGSMAALGWLTLAGVFDALIRVHEPRAGRPDSSDSRFLPG